MKRSERLGISIAAATAAMLLNLAASFAAAPSSISYQGRLTDAAGIDLVSTVPVEVRLYDSAIAGVGFGVTNPHVLYAESHAAVNVDAGLFRIAIGGGIPLDAKWTGLPADLLATKENVYLELWIDGERLSPRQRMGSMPAVIKADRAKYADALTVKPKIEPSMMPSYDASRIKTGSFGTDRIPTLSSANFTQGALPPSAIPNLNAGQFKVGPGYPQLDPGRLPSAGWNASAITGAPLPDDRLPPQLLKNSDIAFGSGVVAHHEMLDLPSGFTPDKCHITYTFMDTPESAEDGIGFMDVTLDGSNIVSCTYRAFDTMDESSTRHCAATYMYICSQ